MFSAKGFKFALAFLCLVSLRFVASDSSDEFEDEFSTEPVPDETDEFDEVQPEPPKKQQKVIVNSNDEEFEATPTKQGETKPKIAELPLPKTLQWNNYMVELGYVAFLLCYGINFFIGRSKNQSIAFAWGRTYKELFDDNFVQVGGERMLVQDGQNVFVMRATGRVNCIGLQAVLELKKRHDLIYTIYQFLTKAKDKLTIDVALENMEPMVFGICSSKDAKNFKQTYKDISFFTKQRTCDDESFPEDRFSIFSESEEVSDAVLLSPVVEVLKSHCNNIDSIHFSDQFPNKAIKQVLRFVFYLPPANDMESLKTLVKMAIFFIDHVAALHLSPEGKKKALERRSQAFQEAAKEKAEERQETLRKKVEEKRKKEGERLKKLTPEQQAKEEQRLRRREAKRTSKVKVVFA